MLGDDSLRWQALLTVPLIVVVAKVQGLYDRDALLLNKTTLDEAPKLFQVATLYTFLLTLTQSHFVDGQPEPDAAGRALADLLRRRRRRTLARAPHRQPRRAG